jgi:hypothetical protein
MSTKRFPLIGGRTMRVTKQDSCGRPAYGDRAQIASEGFVSVAVTANYDDGEEISVVNANGKKCVSRAAEPELTNLSLDVTFCDVDPDIYTAVTGFPKIVDPVTGDTIGFRINRGIRPADVKWGLEVWSNAQGTAGCEPGEDVPYGYLLWPFLSGARVGDYTIENGAVTFVASGAVTNDGSQWGVGPYLVVEDETGTPDFLQEAVDALDHQWVLRTLVGPPAPTDGLVPLDDPDGTPATTATAGIPGTWDGIRPADFATLDAGAYTASPATAWTAGQHVILGDGSKAYWNGTDWVAGTAA